MNETDSPTHPCLSGAMTADELAAQHDNAPALREATMPVTAAYLVPLALLEAQLKRAVPPDDWNLYEDLNGLVMQYLNEHTWAAYYAGRRAERAAAGNR